jgi:phosphoglycolate phosphatase-like HAD superfamily hydrolase
MSGRPDMRLGCAKILAALRRYNVDETLHRALRVGDTVARVAAAQTLACRGPLADSPGGARATPGGRSQFSELQRAHAGSGNRMTNDGMPAFGI